MRRILIGGIVLILVAFGLLFVRGSSLLQKENFFKSASVENSIEPVEILNVGDVLLARDVGRLLVRHGNAYPFEFIGEMLMRADITIGNLEGPIIAEPWNVPDWTLKFAHPPEVAEILASVGFDAVVIANNHIKDAGLIGVEETVSYLEESFVRPVGAIPGVASRDAIFSAGDERVGVLAFSPYLGSFNLSEWRDQIRRMDEQATFVVVNMHWGAEYEDVAYERDREVASVLIDAGADVIVGHHPHVVQDVEIIEDVPVFYSLGNFIFDQYDSPKTQEGLAVRMLLYPERVEFELIPLNLGFAQPSLMQNDARYDFLTTLAERSDPALRESLSEGRISMSRPDAVLE